MNRHRPTNRVPGIYLPKDWQVAETEVTPESVYLNRRHFLKGMGALGLSALAAAQSSGFTNPAMAWGQTVPDTGGLSPSKTNAVTPESLATGFNNFYEFTPVKTEVKNMAGNLDTQGWTIKVGGLVRKPKTLDVEKVLRTIQKEERIYRLRCVETWTATIPWTGFPLKDLIALCEPLSKARHVAFKTFVDPNIAPGQKSRFWEPWPYVEGLRMDEALHDLTFIAVGMYGRELPAQNGAPLRLVVPWKYGFKSIKSIAAIEFTEREPNTFWQTMQPLEYDFLANVDPKVPYARWNQNVERVLTTGEDITLPTRLFNGYAGQVASLYA